MLLAGTDLAAVGIGALFIAGVRPPDIELGILAGALLALQAALGSYRPKLALSALDDLPTTLVVAMGAGAVETTWLTVLGRAPSSEATLVRVVALALSVAVLRAIAYAVVRTARRRGHFAHPTLVLGGGDTGRQVAVAAAVRPEHGLAPLGIVGVAPADGGPLPVPFLGGYEVLEAVIRRWSVTEVVVAVDDRDWFRPGSPGPAVGHGVEEAVRTAHGLGCAIFFVLRPFEPQRRGRDVDHLWGIPVVRVRIPKPDRGQWRIKRVFDATVAGLTLLLLAPVMVMVAAAVRWEVGHSVVFRQVRVGLDGRQFTLLKFRSLRPAEGGRDEGSAPWSISDDSRLGPVGRFIRATSLDELPQLINVLRGEMSLVGPRPERPSFVAAYEQVVPWYPARHRVPAGLTGWAQVNGLRGDTSIEDRVRFDIYYIQHWSMWLDLKILTRTVASVVLRRGS